LLSSPNDVLSRCDCWEFARGLRIDSLPHRLLSNDELIACC
jgi:hypothetical protein